MDAVQELIELEALKRLKARYFHCVDAKDSAGWLKLFASDATFQFDDAPTAPGQSQPGKIYVGPEIAAVASQFLTLSWSVHFGYSPLIDVLSDCEARGIWGMQDILDVGGRIFHGYGNYHETYRKIDGVWKFSSVHLKRHRLDIAP